MKYRKPYLFVLSGVLLMLAFWSCDRYHNMPDQLPGSDYITGRLFLIDTLLGDAVPAPAPRVAVRISDKNTGEDFLFSDTTDADGYFSFEHLQTGRRYYLTATTIRDSVTYSVFDSISANAATVPLILRVANQRQSVLQLIVLSQDSTPLPGADICMFNVAAFANDTTCSGNIWSGTTNRLGKAMKANLPQGRYYISARYKNGVQTYVKRDTVDLIRNDIKYDIIRLDAVPVQTQNGIFYTVFDSLGGILPQVNICAFNSLVLANDSCLNRSWYMVTDSTGRASIRNIYPATYYVFFKFNQNGRTLVGRDTIFNLGQATQYRDTIYLR